MWKDGEHDTEVTHRVQSLWNNWKSVSGVLCDRKRKAKIKGKLYRTVVISAEVPSYKALQDKNDKIRDTTKVGEISKKVQVNYADVLWACAAKRATKVEVQGEGRNEGLGKDSWM